MAKTLEQILGGQPNLNLQDVNLAESIRTGKYVPNTQQANHAPSQIVSAPAQTTDQSSTTTTEQKPMSYADLFVATNPYRPQTAEEREAERKRNRRNAVFAAIGDGISALSNLYFTTKGAPNAYTGGSTLSGKLYERQEQLRKERQALDQQYFNAYMNAMKMDRDEDYKNKSLRLQLDNIAYNRDRQAKQDERQARLDQQNIDRYNAEQEYKKEKDKQTQENWERQFNATQANQAASRAETRRYHDQQLQNKLDKDVKTLRGTQQTFADGKGNELSIWGNVWKGSMPKVLDAILLEEYNKAFADNKTNLTWEKYRERRLNSTDLKTKSKQDDYVHNNWNKNASTIQMMQVLSNIDPANIANTVASGGSIWDGDDEETETDW